MVQNLLKLIEVKGRIFLLFNKCQRINELSFGRMLEHQLTLLLIIHNKNFHIYKCFLTAHQIDIVEGRSYFKHKIVFHI
jgi:hypothetical protein